MLTIHLLSSAEAEKQYRGQNYYFTEKGEVKFNLAVFSDFELD
jgi:YHS domain-containing protein